MFGVHMNINFKVRNIIPSFSINPSNEFTDKFRWRSSLKGRNRDTFSNHNLSFS